MQAQLEMGNYLPGTHETRNNMLVTLTDADLAFTPGGSAMTLGELLREWGEVEHSYIESFRTFTQSWDWKSDNPDHSTQLTAIRSWYDTLDRDLLATLDQISAEDVERTIARDFDMPVVMQLDVYLQALLIFMGKLSIYLRALGKPLDEKTLTWIG